MEPITIIYTHNLGGQLERLPKLHTLIRRLRRDYTDVVLLDMGGSCTPDVWHCAATGGRSTLLVLDAMGYDAVTVTGLLTPAARDRLPDTLQLALIDADSSWSRPDLRVGAARDPDATGMQVVTRPAETAVMRDGVFYPQRLSATEVGVAQLGLFDHTPELFAHAVHPLPPSTRPDPTIAGAVDFVLSEARYVQKRQGDA